MKAAIIYSPKEEACRVECMDVRITIGNRDFLVSELMAIIVSMER